MTIDKSKRVLGRQQQQYIMQNRPSGRNYSNLNYNNKHDDLENQIVENETQEDSIEEATDRALENGDENQDEFLNEETNSSLCLDDEREPYIRFIDTNKDLNNSNVIIFIIFLHLIILIIFTNL